LGFQKIPFSFFLVSFESLVEGLIGGIVKKCFIMRGLPGSGKSTVAKDLAGENGLIFSTDNFFMKDGVYCFDPSLLGKNHALNFEAFSKAVIDGAEIVVVDNTNIARWEYEKYFHLAIKNGYHVSVVTVGNFGVDSARVYFGRNAHGVPWAAYERMIARFEP
jgi:tRNA uridine 5-carbamoylmethylation protein Kti12